MPAKKSTKKRTKPQAEGDRVNASIAASRAAGDTVIVELTREELAAHNARAALVERPGLIPARGA